MRMYDNKGVIALAIVFVVVALLLVRNTNEVVDWYVDSTHVGQRTGGDFIGGDQVAVSGVDDPTDNRAKITIASSNLYGNVTVASGATTKTQAHGMGSTPTGVMLTPATDTLGVRWWVSAIDATNFTVTLSATGGSDITFRWEAIKD